jgi:hypothetical protein
MENESESEKALRVIEYWKKAYDEKNKNKNANKFSIYDLDFTKNDDDGSPFEPTGVLAKAPPNQPIKRSIYSISSLDFTTWLKQARQPGNYFLLI